MFSTSTVWVLTYWSIARASLTCWPTPGLEVCGVDVLQERVQRRLRSAQQRLEHVLDQDQVGLDVLVEVSASVTCWPRLVSRCAA